MGMYVCEECHKKHPHLIIDTKSLSGCHPVNCEICNDPISFCRFCWQLDRFGDTVENQIENLKPRTFVIEVHKSRNFYFVSTYYDFGKPTTMTMVHKDIFKDTIGTILHNNVQIVKKAPTVRLKRVRKYQDLTYIKNELEKGHNEHDIY